MKRSAERALLESEYKITTLQRAVSRDADVSSDTTVITTANASMQSHCGATRHKLLTVDVCNDYLYEVCYDIVAREVFPRSIVDSDAKRRFILNATYAAFCMLVCVEGTPTDIDISVVFPLLVWLSEVALASSCDATELKELHNGHKRAMWGVIQAVAYKSQRAEETTPELQKAARTLLRKSNSRDVDTMKLEQDLFDNAKRITSSSMSPTLVLSAGCRHANSLFSPQHVQSQQHSDVQHHRHRASRASGGGRR